MSDCDGVDKDRPYANYRFVSDAARRPDREPYPDPGPNPPSDPDTDANAGSHTSPNLNLPAPGIGLFRPPVGGQLVVPSL